MTASDSSDTRRQVVEIIGNCVYHALGLKETLEDERNALEKQDMSALQSAIDSKAKCVDELRSMDEERKTLCTRSGFPAGPEQMQLMIEWCDRDSVITGCWQHLMDIASECDALNATNGAIIRSRKQQIENSISIVRGDDPSMDTYNHRGNELQRHNLRSIAEA